MVSTLENNRYISLTMSRNRQLGYPPYTCGPLWSLPVLVPIPFGFHIHFLMTLPVVYPEGMILSLNGKMGSVTEYGELVSSYD